MPFLSRVRSGRNARWVTSLVAVAVLALSACGGGTQGGGAGGEQAEGQPTSGGTLTYAGLSDAGTLDPARCGTNDWFACSSVFGTLLTYDAEKQSFEPGMAESFESTDGLVWTLKLRRGVTFTDGTPYDADAVIANWERVLDPTNFAAGASLAASMAWEKVDDLTVKVTVEKPNYQLPWALTNELAMIGSPAAIKAKGADFANSPVGAGPFTLESWARGTQMTLRKNPGYWDDPRPYVDTLVIKAIPAEEQRLNALRSGEVDAVATTQAATIEQGKAAGFAVSELPFPFGLGLRWSFTKGDLADEDVRTALAMLIEPEQLRNAFYQGRDVVNTMTPKDSPYHVADAVYPKYDVAGAQKLIDGYLGRTGKSSVQLELKMIGGSPQADAQAQMLQAQLQAAEGVELKITAQDAATWFADTQRGNYQLQTFGVSGLNPDQLYKYFHTGASGNTTGYSNPEADKYLDLARTSASPEEQVAAYKKAVTVLTDTVAFRAYASTVTTIFSKPGVVGGLVPAFTFFIRSDLVWVKK